MAGPGRTLLDQDRRRQIERDAAFAEAQADDYLP
jgi:hypothetical protein